VSGAVKFNGKIGLSEILEEDTIDRIKT